MNDAAGPEPLGSEVAWQRLDPRMLLIQPFQEFVKFLPALIPLLLAGGLSGTGPWALFGIGIPVALGVTRFLTTGYRITADRIELRRGLLQRRTTSTRLDRVRTVDLTASPWHRILGLTAATIGTGSVGTEADDRLILDGLPRAGAEALRARLLVRAPAPDDASETSDATPGAVPLETSPAMAHEPAHEVAQEVARFRIGWLRYAPFTTTGLVAAAAALGVLAQGVETFGIRVDVAEDDLPPFTVALFVALLLAIALTGLLLTLAGYVVANGNFRLSRARGAWHVRRGLLTTRETSLDESRIAGVSLGEPALLRAAGGARLDAIATGAASTGGNNMLMPTAPAQDVMAAAGAVLGTSTPLTGSLRSHGPAATRRRWTRALVPTAITVCALVLAAVPGGTGWLIVALAAALLTAAAMAAIARDRSRGLGHTWSQGFVVMRSGSLARRRTALAGGHVIGWTLRDTPFQRRSGLVRLTATTAGAPGRTEVDDVPVADACALAEVATPGLLTPFLAERR